MASPDTQEGTRRGRVGCRHDEIAYFFEAWAVDRQGRATYFGHGVSIRAIEHHAGPALEIEFIKNDFHGELWRCDIWVGHKLIAYCYINPTTTSNGGVTHILVPMTLNAVRS